MSLQKLYQQEKYDRKYIENIYGYICYTSYPDGSLYINELFITEKKRNDGKGTALEKRLIKEEKPSVIFCDVDLTTDRPEDALQAILSADYKIVEAMAHKIILKKDIYYAK